MLRLSRWCCFVTLFLIAIDGRAQYKGDHLPGFVGLNAGTDAPPGLYVGNVVWVYPTDTIKDDNGRAITLPGSLTSTADVILVTAVTNYKLFGGDIGGSVVFPFIKNRIQSNSLDVSTAIAYTDMIASASLGWHLKRADITAGLPLHPYWEILTEWNRQHRSRNVGQRIYDW
jgi:hypothetical protein